MASNRPIIASDVSALREILDESMCYIAKPNNAEEWKAALHKICNDTIGSMRRAKKASEEVKKYTWHERAQAMLYISRKDR